MHALGCDVSKQKLDFSLLPQDDGNKNRDTLRQKSKSKTVANTPAGIEEMLKWLRKNGVEDLSSVHVAMEGTGIYHEVAAYELSKHGVIVSVCNPAQTKSFGRGIGIQNKNDRIDSYVLAHYCQSANPRPWTPPSPEAYDLKSLVARTDAITSDLVREKNRAEKAAATRTPEAVVRSIHESIAFLKRQLASIQETIDKHIASHESLKQDMRLLTSIPAIGNRVGTAMLAVQRRHTFDSAEQLAAYLGLVPIMRQSGTSLAGKSRTSHQGPKRLRSLLYMAAVCAIRKNNGNPLVQPLYERLLKKGKAKKLALGAVMRKLVHICFGVLKNKTPFDVSVATGNCSPSCG